MRCKALKARRLYGIIWKIYRIPPESLINNKGVRYALLYYLSNSQVVDKRVLQSLAELYFLIIGAQDYKILYTTLPKR